jgi:hypothetical protein
MPFVASLKDTFLFGKHLPIVIKDCTRNLLEKTRGY